MLREARLSRPVTVDRGPRHSGSQLRLTVRTRYWAVEPASFHLARDVEPEHEAPRSAPIGTGMGANRVRDKLQAGKRVHKSEWSGSAARRTAGKPSA